MNQVWIQCEDKNSLLTAIAEPGRVMIAGGTDLLINVRRLAPADKPAQMVDLSLVEELKNIHLEGNMLTIGSMVTYTQLMTDPLIRKHLPVLAEAASQVGSPQIRNRGTLGGSLVNASPAADMAPLWILLKAQVKLESFGKERILLVEDFLLGHQKTMLAPGEVMTEIRCLIPKKSVIYQKIGRRNAAAIARLNGCCLLDRQEDTVKEIRLVIGAATPTPLDLQKDCSGWIDKPWTIERLDEVASQAMRRVEEISGRRASATWKFPAIENLVRRLLLDAWAEGGKQ